MARYVALLRGINVGGKNLVKMTALKACFEEHEFRDVVTYIQSGNVVFTASGANAAIVTRVEAALVGTFGFPIPVVIKSQKDLQQIVDGAPKGFGSAPAKYRYDVLFLKPHLSAKHALDAVPAKDGVDEKHAGTGVLYFRRLISKATQSRLSRVVGLPIYKDLTIRNWATTTKLLALMSPT